MPNNVKCRTERPLAVIACMLMLVAACKRAPYDWGDFDVLATKPPRPGLPVYNGKQVPYNEYLKWVRWGHDWFLHETFGNERVWTDAVGLINGTIDVQTGPESWRSEPFFKYFIQAIDALDSVRGNLYQGNGGPQGHGYTNDLIIEFPQNSFLDKTFPIPERLHTGLDVEAGSAWPIGMVPVPAAGSEANLPYLLDPGKFSEGPRGVGAVPGKQKFRIGLSCALCHSSLDVDWDGKPDLRSVKWQDSTQSELYRPEHALAVGNQDAQFGWIFAFAQNTIAGFANSGRIGKNTLADSRAWAKWILDNYESHPDEARREVDRGLLVFPRGYADDLPDGMHNTFQLPVLFTQRNWPYNYDGTMLNLSDRNNTVWTNGLDPSTRVALCADRGGKTAKLTFWSEKGMYSVLSSQQYAEIVAQNSPAVKHDLAMLDQLRDDILGLSDGMPGLTSSDALVIIRGVPGAVPRAVREHEQNKLHNRLRESKEFGTDGRERGVMVGLLGTRVITPPEIRRQYNIDALEKKYDLNGDEFITEAVSMMLDWLQPPTNHSKLLAQARQIGLVERGYEVFKAEGCAKCHAGPFFTNNQIVPIAEVKTDPARVEATAPLRKFFAPRYDPATGKAISLGIFSFLSGLFGKKELGYKVVTLRYLWGSAPYLHDGGVAVALRPGSAPPGDDLQALLQRSDKVYGVAQILNEREQRPASYYRPDAALSLQALLLASERDQVIAANREALHPVPGTADHVPVTTLRIQGVGHEYWIDDDPGGDRITALVAFLLALDDEPGR